ncbi:MAG TPA: 30S ribosomal protein S11 [Candidatus Saccharimonadales bacterium]|nr:30S ribosomal protein S11 [Candidatus Saccharimonadales bacterium]
MADEETPVVETTVETAEAPKVVRKKKVKRSVPVGQVHILASFNNTIVTFADNKGGTLASSSAGGCGFRGSKKGTAYAAQVAMEKAGQIAKQQFGLSKVEVFVKGVGLGRESAIRSLQNLDMHVESIKDVTGMPHGGVRPPKARRV